MHFSQGARGEKPENTRLPFWLYGESVRTSLHGLHILYCGSAVIEMPSWECRLRCAIAVEARRRRAATASI